MDGRRIDGALLFLRAAALFLFLTFGLQKASWYAQAIAHPQPLVSVGLAPLLRQMGFPLPTLLAVLVTLNETAGALLVAIGFLTRIASCSLSLSMIGAFYVSLRVGEDSLRALLYAIAFATLALAGAGRWSIDYRLHIRRGET